VTGGTGFLGKKLLDLLGRKHQVSGVSRVPQERKNETKLIHIDIRKKEMLRSIYEVRPDIIVHTAALTDPNICELNKKDAWEINVIGTRNIVSVCKKIGAKLIYISSDYVFNEGAHREDSSPQPANYYGWTKLEGEREVKEELFDYVILRPTIMYGFNGEKVDRFTAKVRNSLSRGESITVSPRIIKYPVLIDDVARFISTLIDLDCCGIYHIAGPTAVSRYEWAHLVARTYALDENMIRPGQEERVVPSLSGIQLLSTKDPIPEVTPLENGLKIAKMQEQCILRTLYFNEPFRIEKESSIALIREKLGELLAKHSPADGDIICPIPLSGYYYALGYSKVSKIPIDMVLYKDREDKFLLRSEAREIRVIGDLARGKRIILIDEAIFTGETIKNIAKELRKNGAKEVHVRVIYLPLEECKFRVLDGLKLMDCKSGLENVRKELGVDSLDFLPFDKYPESYRMNKCTLCCSLRFVGELQTETN
jgi:dTDP-4-dehydrorhamnose reductase